MSYFNPFSCLIQLAFIFGSVTKSPLQYPLPRELCISHPGVVEPQMVQNGQCPYRLSFTRLLAACLFINSFPFLWQSTLQACPRLGLGVPVPEPHFPGDLMFTQQHSSLWQASWPHTLTNEGSKPTSSADF